MTSGLPVATPKAALQAGQILTFAFATAPLIYILVGEVLRFSSDEFAPEGFNSFGDAIWLVRAGLVVWLLVTSLVVHRLLTDERFVQGTLARETEPADGSVVAAIQAAMVLRFAVAESLAILALVVYVNNADRIEYVFMALTSVQMLLLRPQREKWEATFRQAALEHPTISSSPW
jgi:hypothetical protein